MHVPLTMPPLALPDDALELASGDELEKVVMHAPTALGQPSLHMVAPERAGIPARLQRVLVWDAEWDALGVTHVSGQLMRRAARLLTGGQQYCRMRVTCPDHLPCETSRSLTFRRTFGALEVYGFWACGS